jgi:hypothetical protein
MNKDLLSERIKASIEELPNDHIAAPNELPHIGETWVNVEGVELPSGLGLRLQRYPDDVIQLWAGPFGQENRVVYNHHCGPDTDFNVKLAISEEHLGGYLIDGPMAPIRAWA